MGERLIKPYEISVWEDKLTPIEGSEPVRYKFQEKKLAVIGSDTMTGLNKVYDPIFHKKTNGEKTLTFSLKYKYFDPYSGNEDVVNPFAALLVNERKVKLYYDNKWYEFIIRDHVESSDELTWTYTCTDAFILELSKNGYNITFDSELDNNQGTANELAEKTLENTDWQVGNSDIFKQYIDEPIYKAVLVNKQDIDIRNVSGTTDSISSTDYNIYVFYSYVKNKNGKFVQFIIRDNNYTIDDKNVITDTNFRIYTELVYDERPYPTENDEIVKGFWLVDGNKNYILIIRLETIENRYHANRLAYNQLTTYDSVMKRTVDRFTIEDGDTEIYRYTDYKYTTSDIVVNYITNGENFNALEDGTLQGWNPYTDQSTGDVHKLELVTKPELSTNNELAKLSELSSIEGFLKVQFNDKMKVQGGKIYNTLYNSGIENHISMINSIAKGDKFVFRWRAATGDINNLSATQNLRLIVAKYTQDLSSFKYYKHINADDIILEFTGNPIESHNLITNGTFQENQDGTYSYVINGVAETPSTKYIYVDGNEERVWNGKNYVFKEEVGYRPYYYLIATARQAISNAELKDRDKRIGIFIYNTVEAGTYFLQDIQLTRYYEDETGKPILMGNAPVATSIPIEYYYIKPDKNTVAEDVQTYADLSSLADALGINVDSIKPLYNTDSEKILSISVSKSNCFNILQTIAETFECWVDLEVEHDEQGYIVYDENDIPQKYVYLREYVGKDNWSGFKYGINVQSIEREVNSEEIVTKLLVDQSQSDLVEEGYVSISNAPSNQSEESFILNFDYYYNQGLLNRAEVEVDKNRYIESLAKINQDIKVKEKERQDLENALTTLGSKKTVYSDLLTTAQDTQTRDLDEFYNVAHMTYEQYQLDHTSRPPEERLTENENIYNLIGELYTTSAVINNYSGLLAVVNKQYQEADEKLHGVEGTDNIGVEKEVGNLIQQKTDLINNFENKYRKYILEGTWNSTDYIDPELYYLDAIQVSNTSAQPVVSYTINVVEVSQLEGLEDYEFDVGDKSYIEDTEFFGWANKNGILTPAREEVIVSEAEWHLDSPEENVITIQNYKTRFEDLFQRVNAAVQTVQYNEATYAKISSLLDANGTINQDVLISSLNNIAGKQYNLTSDGSIIIDQDRILVQNLNNPENLVIINSEGIRISSDGGQTWRTAIDGQGINIGTVYTGTLNTNSVIIGNSNNPSFRWDKSGISAYKTYSNRPIYMHCRENEDTVRPGTNYYIYNENIDSFEQVINPTGNPFEQNYYRLESPYDLQTFVRYDQYGLYGIKNNQGFIANSVEDVKNKAHFAVTWDGFFIRNDYTGGGRVEITSENDFRVLNTVNNQENEKIKIGALEWMVPAESTFSSEKTYYILTENGYEKVEEPTALDIDLYYEKKFTPQEGVAPSLYGIRIKNNAGIDVMKTDDEGNLILTGAIEALEGNFSKLITVGKNDETVSNWIIIDGEKSIIQTSDYHDGASNGWMINSTGDAVFNNITARGAIKTAVFEYAEIQAVGGVFIFRPSSTIKSARLGDESLGENPNDLIVKVEKPLLFEKVSYNKISDPTGNPQEQATQWYERASYGGYKPTTDTSVDSTKEYFIKVETDNGSWCKISNYTSDGADPDSTLQNILRTNGLTHVYKVLNINSLTGEITLEGAKAFVTAVKQDQTTNEFLASLAGGALIDMGRQDGSSNYGIGVNSSDNTVNLPARAISLFETVVNPTNNLKVTYNIRGILGTLPRLEYTGNTPKVDELYHQNLEGTQGIYTDNMYIGDHEQYISFYSHWENRNDKHLVINTKELTLKAGSFSAAPDISQHFVYLSNNNYTNEQANYIKINDSDLKGDWRLIIGRKFGVDRAGNLYASNANISGHIHATSGSFGSGAEIIDDQFVVQQSSVNGLENSLDIIMNEASHKGYTLYVEATNETQNSITLVAHVYYGNKEITQNMDSGLFLWYKKSEDSNTKVLLESHVKSVVFDKTTAGYGTTIICSLALDDEVLLITPDYYALETPDGYLLTAHV